MSYEPPIKLITNDFSMKLEDEVVKAVQKYFLAVDKEELFKALQYDRGQYEKGFKDGFDSREITEQDVIDYCDKRCLVVMTSEMFYWMKSRRNISEEMLGTYIWEGINEALGTDSEKQESGAVKIYECIRKRIENDRLVI